MPDAAVNLEGAPATFEKAILSRARSRGSLLAWACRVGTADGQSPAAHHRFLLKDLENLTQGEFDRLMLLMPPGSAKSTYASVVFPAWWLCRYPRSSIIVVTHSASLATHFSRRIQRILGRGAADLGVAVSRHKRAADSWITTAGGEFLATGVRVGLAGRRADLIVIDDPIGSLADAESAPHRDHLWDWYRSDLVTRLRPSGKIVLIMTRWHPDDLGGRLISQTGPEWRVVRLPALAEANDPLGRRPGEALWPDWEDAQALLRKRDLIGERMWEALFQQRPQPAAGRLFSMGRLAVVQQIDIQPAMPTVRAWDLAATSVSSRNDPDWTVGVRLGRLADSRYIVQDVVRIRGTPREVEDLVLATARADGTSVIVAIPEDPGQAGKSQRSYLTRQLAGFVVVAARESGSKATRAMPLASQIEAGNVVIAAAPWNASFLEELEAFPFGRKDDQVDALVRAFVTICDRPEPIKSLQTRVFQR